MFPFQRVLLIGLVWCLAFSNSLWTFSNNPPTLFVHEISPAPLPDIANATETMYRLMDLEAKGLSPNAFEYAMEGYNALKKQGKLKNDSILTVVDFDQPSYNKRMYVIDVKHRKLLFNTWSAHGKNTGAAVANKFSNRLQSLQSSLGLYITESTYNGSNGYSLRLIGLEPCNNNAWRRAIVMHGASYVSQQTIKNMGYIGRSWGCPAIPQELCKPIINTIKGGSCLFLYHKSYKPSL
ncbi:MAG: murein L,D-transpeptidase catalytic domain family protein [Petrimonas sp.]|nr:murein L,D-transpeptidase catalytic domain family protein [Petrimonas sp.]